MKKYMLGMCFLLTGCFTKKVADNFSLHVGDTVTVVEGFYKDCTGYVTEYRDDGTIDDMVTIEGVVCSNVTIDFIDTQVKFIKKVNND